MPKAEMSGVIKERRSLDLIIQEICMTCIAQGLNCTEGMAKYAVSIVTLDKKNKSKTRHTTDFIFRITALAVRYLMSMQGIKARLLVAEAYYQQEFKNESHVVEKHRKMLNFYAEPLLKHIIIYDRAHPDHAMVLRHIVLLTIIMTGMGDPTNHMIYKEAEAAVTSVMSTKDVIKFIHLSQYKKRIQLQQIIKLVTGIRIYNRARCETPTKGTGLDDIDDLPRLLVTSISTIQSMVEETMSKLTTSVTNLESTMEECFEWDLRSANMLNFSKSSISDDQFEFAKSLLCLWQEILFILKSVLKNISRNLYEQLKSEDEMRSKILLMMDKLSCKVGVPSKDVFPHFLELFQHWKGFQNRLVLVNEYNKMLKRMQDYANVPEIPLNLLKVIEGELWFQENSDDQILAPSTSIEVFHFNDEANCPVLEFGGYCPVWLTLTDGVLLTGKKQIGVLKYMDKFYTFRDAKAAVLFTQSPETFLSKVYAFGKHNPEYIDILQLRLRLKSHAIAGAGGWTRHRRHFKRDKLVQTETHPIPENIDHKYSHSIWQLKKDACQLADLRHRRTHRTQTRLSHWKRWILSQTYESSTGETQTMKDNYTNVPTLQNFVFGLRGRREECQHVITLTRPVHEGPSEILTQDRAYPTCSDRLCARFGKCECHCRCYGCQRDDKTCMVHEKNVVTKRL